MEREKIRRKGKERVKERLDGGKDKREKGWKESDGKRRGGRKGGSDRGRKREKE